MFLQFISKCHFPYAYIYFYCFHQLCVIKKRLLVTDLGLFIVVIKLVLNLIPGGIINVFKL